MSRLRYQLDTGPGIGRVQTRRGMDYRTADGRQVRDEATLAHIRKLAIPPAWTDVWINPSPDGHLQATGRDARGRKQYRYHPDWRARQEAAKYGRLIAFGRALPKLRQRIAADLARRGLPREKVLATVVQLLETTLIRVGNEEYARANKSFGLTTLRDRHAEVNGADVVFEFRAKSGKAQKVHVHDRRLARLVKSCRDVPGQELFQYLDENGERRSIGSAEVNAYLREIAGADFTAKDFRTWAGTMLAAEALRVSEPSESAVRAKRRVKRAVEQVAARLGNTVAVCRKSYIHPDVVDAYMAGELAGAFKRSGEAALLGFLRSRAARSSGPRA